MEIIYIVLIFIVPGMIIKRRSELAEKREVKEKERATIYDNLFDVCILSVIASGFTILILNVFCDYLSIGKVLSMEYLFWMLGVFDYLLKYLFVLAAVMFVEYWGYKLYINKRKGQKAKSWNEKFGLVAINEDHRSVWEEFFLNKERNSKLQVVSIYKDGNYITSGCLQGRNVSVNERKEFEIARSTEIEKILSRDKKLPPQSQALNYINDSYFDMDTGVLIQFYDSDYVYEHWDEIMEEING